MSSPSALIPATGVDRRSGLLWTAIRRKDLLSALVASLILLIPCFWHPRVEAGDVASHTYNAWLSSLVLQGKAPGLWIAPQHNNVLFDLLLLRTGSWFGFMAAEKIATSFAVLLFFWAAFALVSLVNERLCWFLAPLLAMLTYGWTLQMGFMNFYLSLALSFLALSLVWKLRRWRALYALGFVPLIWLAHPLGLAWFIAAAAYVTIARYTSSRRWVVAAVCLTLMVVLHFFLKLHFPVLWPNLPIHAFTGAPQLFLGARFRFLPWAVLAIAAVCVALEVVQGRKTGSPGWPVAGSNQIALQLFGVSAICLLLLPEGIKLPQYSDTVLFLCSRFTLPVGVIACCAMGALKMHSRWAFGILTGVAALTFFGLLYGDTAHVFAMEQQAETLVTHVPQDARIIATLFPPSGSQVFSHHVVARACIGRCFVVDNYEAGSGQFRLRASAGNRIVAADPATTNEMMMGFYDVKAEDLPLWHIFQCGPSDIDLCLRRLKAGPLGAPRPAMR